MKTKALAAIFSCGLALAGSTATTAHATPTPEQATSQESCAAKSAESGQIELKPVTGSEATAEATRILESIKTGDFDLHAGDELDVANAKVNTILSDKGQATAVTFPIGGEYSLTSNATFVKDAEGNIVQYSQTLVTEGPDSKFHVETYSNGDLTKNENTDIDFMSDADLKASQSESEAMVTPYGIGSTVACLAAVSGIGGAAGYLIATACAGSCVAVETGIGAAICAACIGGYATLGAGGMTAAASCFK